MTIAPDALLATADVAEDDVVEATIASGRVRAFARSTPVNGDARQGSMPVASRGALQTGDTQGAAGARSADAARSVLSALYAAHAASIQRFLRDLLGDATLAADGTQETFARAFRRLDTLREDDKHLPWLFGIARNVSLEYRKARRVAKDRFAGDGDLDTAPCGGRSPEAQLLGREAATVVSRALADLPEERRAALLLRLDHSLSYDEIAAALGWSQSKAKVEVFRAREVLRAILRTYEGGAP